MMTTETLGDIIRRRRQELGWTQRQLADKMGRSQRLISSLELGVARGSRTSTLADLSDALGIPYDDLALAAGVVHRRDSALKLRRMIDAMDADARLRLEDAHAALDEYLLKMDAADLAYMVDTARLITKHHDAD